MSKYLGRLLNIISHLRNPKCGCPWDIQQTFKSIVPYTIEEAYEVADAIEKGDHEALCDELGDLLFQVVFHARLAEEAGYFNFDAVACGICEKMIRRHPHVFGGEKLSSVDVQISQWEKEKALERSISAAEKGQKVSVLDDIPITLPALTYADKIGRRAANVGFDWTDTKGVFAKFDEELQEVITAMNGETKERVAEEIGDLLFTASSLARHLGVDPEASLRASISKFDKRFRKIEASYERDGLDMSAASIEDMEARWNAIKKDKDAV